MSNEDRPWSPRRQKAFERDVADAIKERQAREIEAEKEASIAGILREDAELIVELARRDPLTRANKAREDVVWRRVRRIHELEAAGLTRPQIGEELAREEGRTKVDGTIDPYRPSDVRRWIRWERDREDTTPRDRRARGDAPV